VSLNIVFENENFVVADKEAGVLSTPSRHEAEDNRRCLGRELEEHYKIQIFPVHRLDFEVSGLVLYAKNADAHRKSNVWFEDKTVTKTYAAMTTGQDFSHIPADIKGPRRVLELNPGEMFEWKCSILRGKRRSYESPHGKQSLTRATYKGRSAKKYHQWYLEPVTGRPHQLRFELSRHGFPIVGDSLYGSRETLQKDVIALRAFKIDFTKAEDAKSLGLPEIIEVPGLF
jgi:tRNA pseudouridine32 synthase/23S rRNA pseudouridine746 synthase